MKRIQYLCKNENLAAFERKQFLFVLFIGKNTVHPEF